jgi:hypothetical protein
MAFKASNLRYATQLLPLRSWQNIVLVITVVNVFSTIAMAPVVPPPIAKTPFHNTHGILFYLFIYYYYY